MTTVDHILDLVAKIERGDDLEKPVDTKARAEQFGEEYEGSPLDLYLVADALEQIGDTIKSAVKGEAYSEAILKGGGEKFTHRGISISPRESYHRYDFPEDAYIEKVEEEMDTVKEQMKPLKKELKSLKKSVKDREQTLIDEGKAEFKGSTKIIAIDRK